MININGIEDVDVCLKFNTPSHTIDDRIEDRGTIRMTADLTLTFTGEVKRMAAGLLNISHDRITRIIIESLSETLGQDIMKGGCHVNKD